MTKALLLASAAVGAAMLPLGAAEAQTAMDWAGFYAGLHAGYLSGDVRLGEYGLIEPGGPIHGFVGGVLGGYNFASMPLAPVVLGVEADIGWASVEGTGEPQADCSVQYLHYDLDWIGHLRVRAGLPMGNLMPFIAGGLALGDLNVSGCEGPFGGVYTGGSIGGGLDFRLGSTMTMIGRVEVLYDIFREKDYGEYSGKFNAWTVRAALIFPLR